MTYRKLLTRIALSKNLNDQVQLWLILRTSLDEPASVKAAFLTKADAEAYLKEHRFPDDYCCCYDIVSVPELDNLF